MHEFLNSPLGAALGLAVGVAPVWLVIWWLNRHDHRRWELREQLREMEQVIYEETLPDEQRAWRQQYRAQQAEITREARRRLGLPEEEGP
jgi:hypothetical protein